ncbi:GlxA family transcriptional regulator [Kocuria turfanensis]|uniref:AraC family transcriptional regulator n=1 Tax=Kocuria turfanensis TaxID=388357 RepID=A0A512IGQ3_9MICC|nr:GlxA family transcriptional regulator [Kocuria turfanensis]GEO96871.1 AraC family transcriptional regulator [Kocuria turfanensis]
MADRSTAVLAYEGAELLDIACITTPLSLANLIGRLPDPYRVQVLSLHGAPIRCQTGLTLQADGALERVLGPVDTVIVAGGVGHRRAAETEPLLRHVRRLAATSRRVASVCTGASVLAAAGLLDGRRATTHWYFAADLARRYPQVTVDPDPIYIRDGRIATAAGVTSALDLTLSFIEEDHGVPLARQVARNLVTYLQRPGNQAQMSLFTGVSGEGNDVVQAAIGFITTHLDEDLSTAAVAAHVGVSPRHLTRLFDAHLGRPPARFVRQARNDAAARLLESSALPVAAIAQRCGFGSAEALRQSFVSQYALSPTEYRARFTRPSRPVPAI